MVLEIERLGRHRQSESGCKSFGAEQKRPIMALQINASGTLAPGHKSSVMHNTTKQFSANITSLWD
jgi:hypothetical protein